MQYPTEGNRPSLLRKAHGRRSSIATYSSVYPCFQRENVRDIAYFEILGQIFGEDYEVWRLSEVSMKLRAPASLNGKRARGYSRLFLQGALMFELGERTLTCVDVVADTQITRLIEGALRIVIEITHLDDIADRRDFKIG